MRAWVCNVVFFALLTLKFMTSSVKADTIYCDDPELCSMTKRFLRFGRTLKRADDYRHLKEELMQFGNLDTEIPDVDASKRFLRFGRAQEFDDADLEAYLEDVLQGADNDKLLDRQRRSLGQSLNEVPKLISHNKVAGKVLHRARRSAEIPDPQPVEMGKDVHKRADLTDDKDDYGNIEDKDNDLISSYKRFMRFGKSDANLDALADKRFMRFGKKSFPPYSGDKRFMRFGRNPMAYSDKRFMRFGRTPMNFSDKRFMRFGRTPPRYADKRFMRFGKSLDQASDKRFMRFGKSLDQASDKRFMRFGKSLDQTSDKRFMRFGKSVDNYADKRFMRFGRSATDTAEDSEDITPNVTSDDIAGDANAEADLLKRFMRFGKRFMRFGKDGDKRFMRFGKSLDDGADKRFMRFGKSLDSADKRFMRFGKSLDGADKRFMRFGKSLDDTADKRFMRFGKSLDDTADKRFMRFGKSLDDTADKRFMRFGKSSDDTADKRFMRFGKSFDDTADKRFMRFGKRNTRSTIDNHVSANKDLLDSKV